MNWVDNKIEDLLNLLLGSSREGEGEGECDGIVTFSLLIVSSAR